MYHSPLRRELWIAHLFVFFRLNTERASTYYIKLGQVMFDHKMNAVLTPTPQLETI